jgi:hypothetical protein
MMLAKFAFMMRPYRLRRVFLVTRSTMPSLRRRARVFEGAEAVGARGRTTREHLAVEVGTRIAGPGSGAEK